MAKASRKSTGKVKWFDDRMGFGFIESEQTGEEVLLYYAKAGGTAGVPIASGDRVAFETHRLSRGLLARNVSKLDLTAAGE